VPALSRITAVSQTPLAKAESLEIHMNIFVRGAHDEGIYCVDVGVVKSGVVPEKVNRTEKWICVENGTLVT
jgi:hypothetical protein